MDLRSWGILPLFALLCPLSPGAATVSVVVVETGFGGGREGPGPAEASLQWEDALLNVLFEEGHIVSNAPVQRLTDPLPARPGEAPEALVPAFAEARAGGADYLILALLDYRGAGQQNPRPGGFSLRLFSLRPQAFLGELNSPGESPASREEREKAARKLTAQLRR